MADFRFIELDLNKAANLANETKAVISAYERCLATSDMGGLAALRSTIEHRIDALDVFYHDNLVDERSLLFGKQRTKLRKLLNEYDNAVAAIRAGGGGFGGGSMQDSALLDASTRGGGAASSSSSSYGAAAPPAPAFIPTPSSSTSTFTTAPSQSILIRPDQRLTFDHLSWWFAQEGSRELPGMDHAILERVWDHMTRTNVDGKVSVNDVKCWYISFGKKALLSRNPPLTAGDLERELVPSGFMYEAAGKRETVDERLRRAGEERERREGERLERLKEIGKAEVARENNRGGRGGGGGGGGAAATATPSGASRGAASGAAAGGAGGGGGGTRVSFLDSHAPPLHLPSDSFDFQIRMTLEEYNSMRLRMREMVAEGKFKERVERAMEKRPVELGEERVAEAVYSRSEGVYVDPGKKEFKLRS